MIDTVPARPDEATLALRSRRATARDTVAANATHGRDASASPGFSTMLEAAARSTPADDRGRHERERRVTIDTGPRPLDGPEIRTGSRERARASHAEQERTDCPGPDASVQIPAAPPPQPSTPAPAGGDRPEASAAEGDAAADDRAIARARRSDRTPGARSPDAHAAASPAGKRTPDRVPGDLPNGSAAAEPVAEAAVATPPPGLPSVDATAASTTDGTGPGGRATSSPPGPASAPQPIGPATADAGPGEIARAIAAALSGNARERPVTRAAGEATQPRTAAPGGSHAVHGNRALSVDAAGSVADARLPGMPPDTGVVLASRASDDVASGVGTAVGGTTIAPDDAAGSDWHAALVAAGATDAPGSARGGTDAAALPPFAGIGLPRATDAGPAMPKIVTVPVAVGSDRFAEGFASRVRLLTRDGTSVAELVLTPEGCGTVRVSVALDGDRADIDFTAAQADTRAAIEQALPALRDQLAGDGLRLGQVRVDDGSGGANGAQPGWGGSGAAAGDGPGPGGRHVGGDGMSGRPGAGSERRDGRADAVGGAEPRSGEPSATARGTHRGRVDLSA